MLCTGVFVFASNVVGMVQISVFRVFGLFCGLVGGGVGLGHVVDETVDARRGAFPDPPRPPQPRSGVGYRFRHCDEFD